MVLENLPTYKPMTLQQMSDVVNGMLQDGLSTIDEHIEAETVVRKALADALDARGTGEFQHKIGVLAECAKQLRASCIVLDAFSLQVLHGFSIVEQYKKKNDATP